MTKSHLAKIADLGNLREVWRQFSRTHRRTSAGLDGVSVDDFRRQEETNLRRLRSDLLGGYQFSEVVSPDVV
jgi:hypothetical protein